MTHFQDFKNSSVACAKIVVYILFYLNKNNLTKKTWFVHFVMTNISLWLRTSELSVKLKKNILTAFCIFFLNFQSRTVMTSSNNEQTLTISMQWRR